jgi:prophage regulatory protein
MTNPTNLRKRGRAAIKAAGLPQPPATNHYLRMMAHKFGATAPGAPPPDGADLSVRLLSKAEVLEAVGVTFPTLWKWMRAGKFPLARTLGSRPAWVASEVEAWIRSLPTCEYKPREAAGAEAA